MGLNLTDVELVLPRPEFEEVKRLRGEESSFTHWGLSSKWGSSGD